MHCFTDRFHRPDHLIGSPLALADETYTPKAWVKYTDIPALTHPKIHIIRGTVTSVDAAAKTTTILDTADGGTPRDLTYDYLVVATGLRRAWPVVPQSLRRETYLAEAGVHISAVRAAPRDAGVVVVGGGAVGIEMAAELKMVHPDARVALVHSRDRLLSSEPLPAACGDRALQLLREAGVEVVLGRRYAETREVGDGLTEVHFADGGKMVAGVVVVAVSRSRPSTAFLPDEALDGEGLVRVRASLMFPEGVPNAACHFAVGDAVRWSGIKRCGAAMHFGFYAAHNIHELILEKINRRAPKFMELGEIPPMIGLAVGKKAMSYSPGEGIASGEDVMKAYFRDDLGWSSTSRPHIPNSVLHVRADTGNS